MIDFCAVNKYHFDIKINDKNRSNAGTKATEDCRNILIAAGFTDLELHFVKSLWRTPFNLLKLLCRLLYSVAIVKSGSLILVQYPLKGVNNVFGYFLRILQSKNCKCCCIIHDLDSLRNDVNETEIKKEINRLNKYDVVISHNPSMSSWLRKNGFKKSVEEIGFFDYLVNKDLVTHNQSTARTFNRIVFAGNLGRGNFLQDFIATSTSLNLELYGGGFNKNVSQQHTAFTWHGSFSTDEIVREINGDFGLVWDGDSVDQIDGLMGNYQRYNTPHKTSLYLAAGIPVIVSASAAIAPYIIQQQLGFTIDSLSEIESRVATITDETYQKMKANVSQVQSKLTSGDFLNHTVDRVLKAVFES